MFNDTVDTLLSNPEFIKKAKSMFPNSTRLGLGRSAGMSGEPYADLAKVASYLGEKSYINRRERAIINTGLVSLSEIENG
jgi:hypothetical protein